MTTDVLKKPRTGPPVPPAQPPASVPSSYAVILRAPPIRRDVFMVRVMAAHFCQAEAFQQYPHDDEMRASYAQCRAVTKVRDMLREGFLVAAIYPSRDIAETKVASIQEQERNYGGFLPARIQRL